jgi:MFS family permease
VYLYQRFPALAHREFRVYLAGGFISNVGNMVQSTAIAYHVYTLTLSSYSVGLIGLVSVGPLLLFSLFGGVLSDQVDRRKLLFATQCGMALVALALLTFEQAQLRSVGLLYVLVAVGAVARAFDGPARQPLVASLVPAIDLPNAFSLNGISWRSSEVCGPVLAGLLIAWGSHFGLTGLGLCYTLNFITFFAVLYSVYLLDPRPSTVPEDQRAKSMAQVTASIREGLRFVRHAPVIRSAMWIDFWATFFSGADALLPAFALKILHQKALGYGILAASAASGAMVAAAVLANLPPIRQQGRWVVWMIFVYGIGTVMFGLSVNVPMAVLFLAVIGAADMISTVLRQTIRQLQTPDYMRGRMTATASLFHISGPRLGDYEAGALAALTGERISILVGGTLCIAVNSLWLRAKHLVGYEHA